MSYTFRYALDSPKRTDEDLILLTIDFDEDMGATPALVLTPECVTECDLKSHFDIINLMHLVSGVESDIFGMPLETFDKYKKFFINAFYFRKED